MKYTFILALIAFILILNAACKNNNNDKQNNNVVYFKEFDLFRLKGIDTLSEIKVKDYVQVQYKNKIPIYIKYYTTERTITLLFDDSIRVFALKPIYIYSTSNFHGGPPGRHKLYSNYNVEYSDLIYISFSDTIICETKDVPPTKNYHFDLYVKNQTGSIYKISKGEYDYENKNIQLSKANKYIKWDSIMKYEYQKSTFKPKSVLKLPE